MSKDEGRIEKAKQRYEVAAHRVQTAIAFMPEHAAQSPKHMRVGIDMSKADQAGLATLLIEKGLITPEEYVEAVAKAAEDEADRYEHELSGRYGRNVQTY